MLVGYVSDERYVSLADVALEFHREGEMVAVVHSSPRGGVYADLEPGEYRVTLFKEGYGPKSVDLSLGGEPYQFRLLSNRLLGYAWPKWVKSGERSEFRVHSVEPYRLTLWRYGREPEMIKLYGWFDEHGPLAAMQITPDGDYTQTGVRWNKVGYGSPHHTQMAVAPERSGLYYFHAESDTGAHFSFPWIVAPAQPTAKIAVLASTNNWNAYNNFGGRSNYINGPCLPPQPTVNGRQDLARYQGGGSFGEWRERDHLYQPLSFERPEPNNQVPLNGKITDPIRGRQECHLAPAEWRLLGWLEREGFDYDFYSEAHLHFGEIDLDAYQVLIIQVHPEYWTRKMYEQVKDWVFNRGGKLMYLGGNGLNCEVELYEDGDDLKMRCNTQLLCPGKGALGPMDPEDPSIIYESRFHRRVESEACLLGVVCTETGIMTAAPYKVEDASHWIFAGTGVQNGDLFGEKSLQERINGGASGHETDKMSPSSPPGTVRVAKGINRDEGGAEIVYHETASGGAVFSVGSITYTACIWTDDVVSQITANVLNRFLG